MTAPLVFMDTETTGLSLDDDIWEFAAVRREPDGSETELHMFIEHSREKCAALPSNFRSDHYDRYLDHRAHTKAQAASAMFHFTREKDGTGKPHIVGAVPNFDTERVARTLALSNLPPGWHYHLIDVENLAAGYLAATLDTFAPPWDSNDLSMGVGVDPNQFERHTAMGDVRWAMAIYDAVMGGKP